MHSAAVNETIAALYAPEREARLAALRALREAMDRGEFAFPEPSADVNSHIHTTYSFSPYSPAAAVFKSREAGLATTGIMDHDSVSGSREFSEAGRLLGIATTQGCEIRVSMKDGPFADRRINNPDQNGVAYITFHGVPDSALEATTEFLQPIRAARKRRNARMIDNLNRIIGLPELHLSLEEDVVPLSLYAQGGEITERHLLYALALKLIAYKGKGPALSRFVETELRLPLAEKTRAMLDDAANPHYAYDLLGLFKGYYVAAFYVEADEECPDVRAALDFADRQGIIAAYPYLGDVTASVTGDKAAQAFEDAYLDELFPYLKALGFKAVTYMPSRNTKAQLSRLIGLCEQYGFFQISGEDINQPRQKFICEAMREPMFAHLIDAAWALIGHERAASEDLSKGMFSAQTIARLPDIKERTAYFKALALAR